MSRENYLDIQIFRKVMIDPEIKGFILNNYFMAFYAIALVSSLVRYRTYFDTVLKYLPIVIGYTLLTEVLGLLIRDIEEIRIVYAEGYSYYNILIYNIFDIVFFIYFIFVYWKTIKNKKFRRIITWGGALFTLASLINPFLQDFVLYPQMMASSIGSLVLIVCIILYFKELKSNDRLLVKQNLLFWISMGLLIFYTLYPFIQLIGYFDYDLYQQLYLRRILHFLIAVMYSCIILGFLLMKRIQRVEEL